MTQTVSQSSTQSKRDTEGVSQKDREGQQFREGPVATAIEERTAQVPSDTFLWAAGASIGGSLLLHLMDRKEDARFVGQWAPTLLCLGIYNKMVKLHGHDQQH